MQVDYALILAAGFGTRMGEIGKILPKPIWPLFESSLLNIQKKYLINHFGADNIYVNSHHLADKLEIESKKLEIRVLREKEILGSGGAIYNFKKMVSNKGVLLIHNGDQFCFYNKSLIKEAKKKLNDHPVVLFGAWLPKELGHNGLEIDEKSFIKGFKPNEDFDKKVLTYTGTGLINLDKIDDLDDFQNFFSSVANFTKIKVPLLISSDLEYWDFGTLKRFEDSSRELLKKKQSKMYKFMIDEEFMNERNIHGESSYLSAEENCLNFSGEKLKGSKGSIYLSDSLLNEDKSIHFKNIIEKLK